MQSVFVARDRRGLLTGKHLDILREGFASVRADFGAELVELDGEDDPAPCYVPSHLHRS
jgi:REP element-mobilizing transposase RayT